MDSQTKTLKDTHTHSDHIEEHMQGSEVLRDIVIGMSDGLTVPFALAAGLSGAVGPEHLNLIWIAGLAEIAAGSIAMGLGGYLAGKTEVDHYQAELKREYDEVEKVPEREKDEVREFFAKLGLSDEVQEKAVDEMTQDKDTWVDFMMKYELGLDKPDPKRARNSAFNIGLSYIVGGLIPLSPYFFVTDGLTGLKISAVITLICLFIFGYYKSKMTGIHPLSGALRVMIIGALAAGCAFAVAKLIQHG
ncbi:MAG: VIT1/CCC1 transporter family protein [Bacteroidota bacterium]|nr:VIT1/CCC1 transporter family protein [Bacteroidota bacterium]MDP4217755.1 VIT1/CCC1 transporter family protein [Bacteroidota bacterium]MDP4246024.1 VIT1/CCC1 transporter family protein [Bacteroidota bacterium]MDP4253312.1 VIT1/CCC1 transporter family protein [Bacteroidota bacterium]MDP4257344.1 VIT1/CCC1 transporter family protein [Bacteroidota bacterium]